MPAAPIIRRTDSAFVVQVEIPYKPSMLEAEQAIQDALNQAGVAATEEVLGTSATSPGGIGWPMRAWSSSISRSVVV